MHVFLMELHILSGERSRSSFKVKEEPNKRGPDLFGMNIPIQSFPFSLLVCLSSLWAAMKDNVSKGLTVNVLTNGRQGNNNPSGFIAVGLFILPRKTSNSAVLKEWNPNVRHTYCLKDYDRKEIRAVDEPFPATLPKHEYLNQNDYCSFNRWTVDSGMHTAAYSS
ncbi:hypothetical protein DPMN_040804 [Dreissena polymorpha]|uniref:Uncharacterized protein n=1 Tax=Dreissena polymorpha TaxID=45954 RepID=A0A9D4HTE8_DREPO|nr:hypothetical protein DPMN_040804 [Dreissena polymorpha]